MTKKEYIKQRTQYYRDKYRKIKMTVKMAKECAEEDYNLYCEKHGKESLEHR